MGLALWSDAHFDALRPLVRMLADAGQKVVTATLNKDPWNHQCFDAYEDMIRWTSALTALGCTTIRSSTAGSDFAPGRGSTGR